MTIIMSGVPKTTPRVCRFARATHRTQHIVVWARTQLIDKAHYQQGEETHGAKRTKTDTLFKSPRNRAIEYMQIL